MDILRRSIKVYCIGVGLFIISSFIIAALICFTGFKESWSLYGIYGALGYSSLLIVVLESKIVARRGLLLGLGLGLVFFFSILATARLIFL
ncbi:MAG: hypothetical protein GX663_08720 [Clostridiales bacterium]|nr:hypothetical protein [Clostridiales bacterium]